MIIGKKFRFEASHILPRHPGKCSRLHGHSWELTVSVRGPINPETGFVMDYYELSQAVQPLIGRIDHTHLNDSAHEYPSSENLVQSFWGELERAIDRHNGAGQVVLHALELSETCTSAARMERSHDS